MDSKQEDCEARNDDKTMPLFFFFSCKTSGTNFMRHKVMDIAVHCWPYKEDAPMFYSRIHHNCSKLVMLHTNYYEFNPLHPSAITGCHGDVRKIIRLLLKVMPFTKFHYKFTLS